MKKVATATMLKAAAVVLLLLKWKHLWSQGPFPLVSKKKGSMNAVCTNQTTPEAMVLQDYSMNPKFLQGPDDLQVAVEADQAEECDADLHIEVEEGPDDVAEDQRLALALKSDAERQAEGEQQVRECQVLHVHGVLCCTLHENTQRARALLSSPIMTMREYITGSITERNSSWI